MVVKDDMKTIVIFRKNKSKEYSDNITAVFPNGLFYSGAFYMGCYSHIGQHSSCSYDWYLNDTVPAKPEEYASLKKELEDNFGYDLLIRQKIVRAKSHSPQLELGGSSIVKSQS